MSGRNVWEIVREHVEKKTERQKVKPGEQNEKLRECSGI